jgi:hypothetical protein
MRWLTKKSKWCKCMNQLAIVFQIKIRNSNLWSSIINEILIWAGSLKLIRLSSFVFASVAFELDKILLEFFSFSINIDKNYEKKMFYSLFLLLFHSFNVYNLYKYVFMQNILVILSLIYILKLKTEEDSIRIQPKFCIYSY